MNQLKHSYNSDRNSSLMKMRMSNSQNEFLKQEILNNKETN